ncbi:hypothetical protein DDB_G0289373 [Dictyostelium discoideum AX4]|uniref:hypothetical protein n=1 Tax=Dictyostelium discoideum AX4 TaxID=352472 RepID=UPI00004E43FB|nr:hypothetical protein DDB_G0289373 [Dictyostelium discoideum AX4]EAL62773.1 hypothetical protein DDB_G0289373 [Dictyostelium discoideum AX4]|eukprot:XP_636265.1 hypothetical protein DDB_G0289373 [Dictyostelium discoideum AX4]
MLFDQINKKLNSISEGNNLLNNNNQENYFKNSISQKHSPQFHSTFLSLNFNF